MLPVNPSPKANKNVAGTANFPPHGSIPDGNTILRWMQNMNATGSVLKNKSPGREVEAISQVILQDSMRHFRERLEKCILIRSAESRQCNFFYVRF